MITGEFLWQWGIPESLGIVAYGGTEEIPEWGYSVHKFIPDCDTANELMPCWFCYLGGIPDIKEPSHDDPRSRRYQEQTGKTDTPFHKPKTPSRIPPRN